MPEPKPLRASINRLMQKRGYLRPGGDEALADAWADALAQVGQSPDGTRVLRLSRRTLHIGVADASRRSELDGFHREPLLASLGERHPDLDVRQLKFELLRATEAPEEPWFD